MNSIKGLIIKDILQLKSYKKSLIMFILIFFVLMIAQKNTEGIENVLTVMMTLIFGMFAIATFNYDESAKADRYILTLPLTKKEILLSKYILIICSTIVGSILGALVNFIIAFVINVQLPNIQELIAIGLGGILGTGFIQAIQIPCIYKYGSERGRIQVFIIVAVIAVIIGGIFFIGDKININLPINNILNIVDNFLPVIFIIVTAIIYYISYNITYKIYSKKEI